MTDTSGRVAREVARPTDRSTNLLSNQVLLRKRALSLLDDLDEVVEPGSSEGDRRARDEGLVADLQDHIIEAVEFLGDPADVSLLAPNYVTVLEGLGVLEVAVPLVLDVVRVEERRKRPGVVVLGIEEHMLTTSHGGSLIHEVPELLEEIGVPLLEIAAVATLDITGLVAASQGENQVVWLDAEGVPLVKLVYGLEQKAGIDAGVVEPVSLEGVEVGSVVEGPVDDCPVVFRRGDQDGRLTVEQVGVCDPLKGQSAEGFSCMGVFCGQLDLQEPCLRCAHDRLFHGLGL